MSQVWPSEPIRVLLVEDNRRDAELVREALEAGKLLVALEVIDDGEKAVKRLSREGEGNTTMPDLILLDMNLPIMNGREVLAEIRRQEHLRGIPVVMLTSSLAEKDILESYALGASCYVNKPVDLDAFQTIVQTISTFWFTVSRTVAAAPLTYARRTAPNQEEIELKTHIAPRTPIRVLLVEDNPGDADLVREAMESSKLMIALDVVIDGEEAVSYLTDEARAARGELPDLVLLDINLPKMNGRQVLAEVKTHQRLRSIPIVMLTSSEADKDVGESYALGANCYVSKPVDLAAFQTIVRSIETFWFTVVRLP